MKPEAQRIAIAEACGWTNCRLGGYGAGGAVERPRRPVGTPPGRKYTCDLPDYTVNLNACHEMEKVLNMHQQYTYGEVLAQMVRMPENFAFGEKLEKKFPFNGWGHFALATSTSQERCEAFLRAIGKWKEED